MKRTFKICITVITIVVVTFFIYFEVGFLLTKHYTTAFIDPLESTNIKLFGVFVFFLISLFGIIQFESRKIKTVFISTSLFIIIGLTTLNLFSLDKSNHVIYRQDLGLQAYHLYLNEKNKSYILEYTWPFGKSTMVGQYDQLDSQINFNKDLIKELYLNGHQYQSKQMSLNLKNMRKLN